MSRAREEAHCSTYDDGELTNSRVEGILDSTACTVTPSVLPNVELVRCAVREVSEHQTEILDLIDETYENGRNLDPEEFLVSMSDAISIHAPCFSSIIDNSRINAYMFLSKNDMRSTALGAFRQPKDASTFMVDGVENVSTPFVPPMHTPTDKKGYHPGITFMPTAVETKFSKLSARNDGEPRIITNYRMNYHGPSQVRTMNKINQVTTVPVDQHKHPIRYALQFFASTIYSTLSARQMENYIILAGTVTEALSIMKYYGTTVQSFTAHGAIECEKKYANDYKKFISCGGVFDVAKYIGMKGYILITADYIVAEQFKQVVDIDDYIIYVPSCDYTKLLRDNSNKALLFDFPKFNGMASARVKFWDRRHAVAQYDLRITPSPNSYDVNSFTKIYRRHPIFSTKILMYENEAPALHFLKICIIGKLKTDIVPRRIVDKDDTGLPDVRPILGMSPIDPNAMYKEFQGSPTLCHVSVRQDDITVRFVDLLTRLHYTRKLRETHVEGSLDFSLICFYNGFNYIIASMIYSSTGVVSSELPDYVYDVCAAFGYFASDFASKKVCGQGFKRDYFYVNTDPNFAVTKPKSYYSGGFTHGHCEGVVTLLPLATTKVIALVSHYITPSDDIAFNNMIFGVETPTEIEIDE